MLKLICFDLDNTLWPMDHVIQRAEQSLLTELNRFEPLKHLTLETLREHKQYTGQNHPSIAHDPTELRKTAIQYLLENADIDQPHQTAEHLMDLFLHERNQVTLFDSTESVLTQLKGEYTLASVTNGNACLNTIGVADYFTISVSPASVGFKKPDAEIFHEVLKRAQLPAEQAIHIGDHWEDDMLGAKSVGFHTLWINPTQMAWPGKQTDQPDGIVAGIDEVPAFLKTLSASLG